MPRGLHLPWRLIIRRFELSDKTYSKTSFEPAIRGSVRRASGLVLADQPPTGLRHAVLGYFVFMLRIPHRLRGLAECDLRRVCQTEQLGRQRVESQEDRRGIPHLCRDCGCIVEGRFQRRIGIEPSTY